MLIALIAAMDRNRLIGVEDRLPWRLPADMRRFRCLTMGKPLVMGRVTHESIGKVLPGRLNIVLSGDPDYRAPGCVVAASLDEAVRQGGDAHELMIIGGARLYADALPRAGRMYLTLLHGSFDGDVHFPEFDEEAWREVSRESHAADDDAPCPYSFVVLERDPRRETNGP
jgi:dihydrofolate reductase